MKMSLSHHELFLSLSKALNRVVDSRNESKRETAKALCIDQAALYDLLSENTKVKKVETYFDIFKTLGARVEVIIHCPELPSIDGRHNYEYHSIPLRNWMIDCTVELLKAKGLTKRAACEEYNLDKNTINFICRGELTRYSFMRCAILMQRLGLHIFFNIEYPGVNLTDLCSFEVPKKKELKVADIGIKYFRTKKTDEVHLIDMLETRTITMMERGQIRTSMGEVVRAFL